MTQYRIHPMANTTKWAMDEQIHLYVAQRMVDAAEEAGWPYEIHTLEDLATYYFGERELGNMPWTSLKEKMFLLHMQDSNEGYDIPEEAASNTFTPQAGQTTYTNYTCGPAYIAVLNSLVRMNNHPIDMGIHLFPAGQSHIDDLVHLEKSPASYSDFVENVIPLAALCERESPLRWLHPFCCS